jgi:hypothetical protein
VLLAYLWFFWQKVKSKQNDEDLFTKKMIKIRTTTKSVSGANESGVGDAVPEINMGGRSDDTATAA